MIPEFHGGSFDPWGGEGFENCAILTNDDFEKVFYRNNFASGLKIVSYYMTYRGTNWGNLGYPLDYTSYDYGAAIMENREVTRAKYSEAKLIANFLASIASIFDGFSSKSSRQRYLYHTVESDRHSCD